MVYFRINGATEKGNQAGETQPTLKMNQRPVSKRFQQG